MQSKRKKHEAKKRSVLNMPNPDLELFSFQ